MSQMPRWPKCPNRERRFVREMQLILASHPQFAFGFEGDTFVAEGFLVTKTNRYDVRMFYPETFPYNAPRVVVMDEDVKQYCLAHGYHKAHNFGTDRGGIALCLLKEDDQVGSPWTPDKGGYFVLSLAALWLCSHEIQRETGRWALPEATS